MFGSLDLVFALHGKQITSDAIYFKHQNTGYYVKRYTKARKSIYRFFGRPRVQSEWQNLARFKEWDIPTADIVAYGMERSFCKFIRGAIITKEITGTTSLEQLAEQDDTRLNDYIWVDKISKELAAITRTLHKKGFTHNDLKWRNILVDKEDKLYLIDCPLGNFWHGPLLRRRMRKDISNLDRIAQYKLSRTQRLRFYLQYAEKNHLEKSDKKLLRQLLAHPSGRASSFGKQA